MPLILANFISHLAVVSWNWNGSTPGGQIAEKKTEGEVVIQSKRGNTIKKDAKPGDPAIHLERPGNDVVKNQSELQVDEKNAGGDKGKEDKKEETNGTNGTKRKAEDEPDAEGEEKAQPSTKKAKAGRPKATPKKKEEEKPKAAADAAADGEKKARGRPKGKTAGVKKEKKPPAPPTGVGKRTRSQK